METIFDTNGHTVRECKITITSRHYVHNPERFAKYGVAPSLFTPEMPNADYQSEPEDYPDEMDDALDEILALEHKKHGSPEVIIDPYAPPESAEADDDEAEECPEYCDDVLTATEEFNRKIEELMRLLSPEDEDSDALIFETRGTIGKYVRDGREVIELMYTEDESMDGTDTVIRFDPRQAHSVTISHTGGVISTLVCDEGKRHITVYETPVMPFELAVYTKKCRGFFTPYGGKIELDYLLELRGADLQRTVMTIEARTL